MWEFFYVHTFPCEHSSRWAIFRVGIFHVSIYDSEVFSVRNFRVGFLHLSGHLCEHARSVLLCRNSYLVLAYTYFLKGTIWRSARLIIYIAYTFEKTHNTLISPAPALVTVVNLMSHPGVTTIQYVDVLFFFIKYVILVLGHNAANRQRFNCDDPTMGGTSAHFLHS
jgi:hypothetical protein